MIQSGVDWPKNKLSKILIVAVYFFTVVLIILRKGGIISTNTVVWSGSSASTAFALSP